MIQYMSGDIFQSERQVLVNPVNTVGVMGKGLALQFKIRFPKMFEEYQALCKSGEFDIGQLHLFRTGTKWILNFPTKKHWRNPAKIEYIEAGLARFIEIYESEKIETIAFPMLGSGLGGLDWETQVKPVMEQYLSDLTLEIEIYV